MKVNKAQIAKYVLLPEYLPRVKELFGTGFVYVSFFMAQIYAAVGLLPNQHPYLNTANIGKYGIGEVMGQAAGRLKFKFRNIDQLIIFFLILAGLVILILQCVLLSLAIMTNVAQAAMPTNFAGFFSTQQPEFDIAFIMLDRVFGIPDIFDSCVANNDACTMDVGTKELNPDAIPEGAFPWAFHDALHSLFQFYSLGLMVVAVLIFLYFVFAVAAETAQAGTPFGRRFNHVWAPIRLVAAIGLLIPVANGLNTAQYIVLYAANFGSSFATNGWNIFLTEAVDVSAGETQSGDFANMVATPNPPQFTSLMEFATIVSACTFAYDDLGIEVQTGTDNNGNPTYSTVLIEPYLVRDPRDPTPFQLVDYNTPFYDPDPNVDDAYKFYGGRKILIRFGHQATDSNGEPIYQSELGTVRPYCGDLMLTVDDIGQPGPRYIYEQYWETFVKDLFMIGPGIVYGSPMGVIGNAISQRYISREPPNPPPAMPDATQLQQLKDRFNQDVSDFLAQAAIDQRNYVWNMDLGNLGWAGGGLWYNEIAKVNGSLVTASYNLPRPRAMPKLAQEIMQQRSREDEAVTGSLFQATASDDESVDVNLTEEQRIARGLDQAVNLWADFYDEPVSNAFEGVIAKFFGLEGLFNMRSNVGIHPLAQLASIGKSLIESAIVAFGYSMGAMLGGLTPTGFIAAGLTEASGFFFSVATFGLSIGFILFYIIPFMPFIYFFFALGGWVKGIFEAMVGVPLWALAHIRIDGNGLPGDAAVSGYFLILEIFLRPILIVFGMLASVTILSAQVSILNEIWDTVVSNVAGFDNEAATKVAADETGGINFRRGDIDKFFYTILYAIVVYMLATASFKLINLIPNHILRWLGTSTETFGDQTQDPTENLTRNTYLGTQWATSSLSQAKGGTQQLLGSMTQRNSGA